MFRHFMTSINMPEFIKIQANQITGRISKNELKGQPMKPSTASKQKKMRKNNV